MSVVQAYARESQHGAEFDDINGEYRDANKQSVFYEAVLDAAIEMVGTVCIASILWWAGLKRISDRDASPSRWSSSSPSTSSSSSSRSACWRALHGAAIGDERRRAHLRAARRNRAGGRRRDADVDTRPAAARTRPGDRRAPTRRVALEDVTFAYKPGVPVLRDVSFHVQRGRAHRPGRRHRRGQDHRHQPAAPPLRVRAGQGARPRQGRAQLRPRASCATCSRSCRRTCSSSRAPSRRTSP